MEQIKNSENGQELAQTNFNRWNNALKSGQAEEVAALYDRAVTFLPTMSKEFKTSQEDAEEYFKHFLEKNPKAKLLKMSINQLEMTLISIPVFTTLV